MTKPTALHYQLPVRTILENKIQDNNKIKLLGSGPRITIDNEALNSLNQKNEPIDENVYWRIQLERGSNKLYIFTDNKTKSDRSKIIEGINFIFDPYSFDNIERINIESGNTEMEVRYAIYESTNEIIACGTNGANCCGPQTDCC